MIKLDLLIQVYVYDKRFFCLIHPIIQVYDHGPVLLYQRPRQPANHPLRPFYHTAAGKVINTVEDPVIIPFRGLDLDLALFRGQIHDENLSKVRSGRTFFILHSMVIKA